VFSFPEVIWTDAHRGVELPRIMDEYLSENTLLELDVGQGFNR
jgi:hypothetical protein